MAMCDFDLPSAFAPLWQEAQLPVTPVWSQRTERNEKVLRWQLSQGAAVSICVEDLARACEPLWQAAQAPMIWLWLKRTCTQVAVVWQASQLAVVGPWVPRCPGAMPPLWQPLHCRGVPLKRPFTWQDVQSTL